MSSKGDEIGAEIAAESSAVSPWPAVGNAVAARLGRTLYYFSAAAVVGFPQSLQGTLPAESVLTANPTAATPALIAQAAMPVGIPNLAIWPAHTTMLHLWTFAPLLPTGEKYSILATLKQVDASGAVIATLRAYPINGDVEFPDDIWSPNWARTDLAVDMEQLQGAADLRLEIDLKLYTSCASALPVQLQIGGDFASYIDTSLTAVGGSGGPVSSVESLDGSIEVTNITSTLQNIELPVSTAIPKPDGGMGSAGTSLIKSNDDHQHPLGSPSDSGGKLWTAFVDDPLALVSVDAVFHEQGGCDPSVFGTAWTEIATGVWRHNVPEQMAGATLDDMGASVGMRVFAWSGDVEGAHTGIYVITDTGAGQGEHYAQMERASDFNTSAQALSGLHFSVLSGTSWGGSTFELTTANPIELGITALTWGIISPPSLAPTQELLTASQLGLASPATVTATVGYVTPASGELDLVTLTERDAVLGGAVLSGSGTWRFHVPVWLTADDPAATTVVNCYVRGDAHTPWVLVATTQALHNTSLGVFVAVGTLGSDYVLALGEKLQVRYATVSDSANGVIVNLTYNDAQHTSFIEIPAVIGYTGTDNHQQLINRGVFLDPANATSLAHPMSAIEPGWLQTPTSQRAVVGGLLALASSVPPVTSNSVTVVGTGPLVGIETTGKNNGDELTLFFLSAMPVTNQGTTGDAAYAPIAFGTMGRGTPPQDVAMTQYSCLRIGWFGGVWRPVAPWFICEAT